MMRRRDPRSDISRRFAKYDDALWNQEPCAVAATDLGTMTMCCIAGSGREGDRAALAAARKAASATGWPLAALASTEADREWLAREGVAAFCHVAENDLKTVLAGLDFDQLFFPEDGGFFSDAGRGFAIAEELPLAVRVVALEDDAAYCATAIEDAELRIEAPRVVVVEPRFSGSPSTIRGDAASLLLDVPAAHMRRDMISEEGVSEPDPALLHLAEAEFVIAAGAGVRDLDQFMAFAHAMKATPGAIRVLVDAGRVPRDRQVGVSGTIIDAELYVGIGISGAIQHLEGIANCRNVIAINTDEGCALASRADLTLVADAGAFIAAVLAKCGMVGAGR
jgi:electron transfer flavoprotein alpha subunit